MLRALLHELIFPNPREARDEHLRRQLKDLRDSDPTLKALQCCEYERLETCVLSASQSAFDEDHRHVIGKALVRAAGCLLAAGLWVLIAAGAAYRWTKMSHSLDWSFGGLFGWILVSQVLFSALIAGLGRVVPDMFARARKRRDLPPAAVPEWTAEARFYVRILAFVILSVGALVAVLTLSARHNWSEGFWRVLISAPLGGLPILLGYFSFLAVESARTLIVRPQDPYPKLVLGLIATLVRLQKARTDRSSVPVLPASTRRDLAADLEPAARAIASNSGLNPWVAGGLSAQTVARVDCEGSKVASWLRWRQAQLLWPSPPAAVASVQEDLAKGLLHIVEGNWTKVKAPADVVTKQDRLTKMLPRFALTLLLLAAAFVIPRLIQLTAAATTTLTVSLVVTALTALATPSDALSKVADRVSKAGSSSS